MEQIRCPKCKERHWVCREAMECLEGPDLRLRVAALEAELGRVRGVSAGIVEKLERKVGADRKAYMREYMRKRRARV